MSYNDEIKVLLNRLDKIGISLEIGCNAPWLYIDKINGNKATEKLGANHGFLIGYLPIKEKNKIEVLNRKEVFDLIRKYI